MRASLSFAAGLVAAACSGDRKPAPSRIVVPPPASALPAPIATQIDPGYVGPAVCGECHEDKLESASKTSHFRTSRPATSAATEASFGEDVVITAPGDESLRLVMLEQDGALYQVGIDRRNGERIARRADVVIGSGKLGQTFLYADPPFLYQLPATYFAAPVGWQFSPGYREDLLDFGRPVFAQCLECHALWAQPGRPDLVYEHSYVGEIRWGVTCEKCHGPGARHAEWHRGHPDEEVGRHIVSPDDLPRERRDDICQLCHSDHGEELAPAFSFRPGEPLRHYYAAPPADAPKDPAVPDVHAHNQMERLALSACYRESEELSCVSCHDPHVFERGDQALFNGRCVDCHAVAGLSASRGDQVRHDGGAPCVDCHMPLSATEIGLRHDGRQVDRARMRDHKIGIYR